MDALDRVYVVTASSDSVGRRDRDWYWTGMLWSRHDFDAALYRSQAAAEQVAWSVRPLHATNASAPRAQAMDLRQVP